MMNKREMIRLLFFVTVATASAYGQSWNHDPSSPIGPNYWGFLGGNYNSFATCGSIVGTSTLLTEVGKQQAPVDIVPASATASVLRDIDFRYDDTPFVVENTGHVVEVPYEKEAKLESAHTFRIATSFSSFIFDAPSEHTINEALADAELHIVHQNALGELAVVGVLLRIADAHANPLFDTIMSGAPLSPGDKDLGGDINVKDLLPKSRSYYTYAGCLTTPPRTEGVVWFVMAQPVAISTAAVDRLHHIVSMFPAYGGYPNNNRPVRQLNGRAVLFNRK